MRIVIRPERLGVRPMPLDFTRSACSPANRRHMQPAKQWRLHPLCDQIPVLQVSQVQLNNGTVSTRLANLVNSNTAQKSTLLGSCTQYAVACKDFDHKQLFYVNSLKLQCIGLHCKRSLPTLAMLAQWMRALATRFTTKMPTFRTALSIFDCL